MQNQLDQMKSELHRLSKTVYGNGKPGLVDEVNKGNMCSAQIQLQLSHIIERFEKHEEEFHRIMDSKSETMRWIITAAIAAFSAASSFFK